MRSAKSLKLFKTFFIFMRQISAKFFVRSKPVAHVREEHFHGL